MYMMVPNIIHKITTLNINTNILVLLRTRALTNELDSPIKWVSFRILKTLRSRRALSASRDCVPTKKRDIYLGIIETKSIIP
tara:strand:- start:57 stop:302 length:246 start_codon:yes stop_codon:yes gene_type:complete